MKKCKKDYDFTGLAYEITGDALYLINGGKEIGNSYAEQAEAKPGDTVTDSKGVTHELTQGDINWAKQKIAGQETATQTTGNAGGANNQGANHNTGNQREDRDLRVTPENYQDPATDARGYYSSTGNYQTAAVNENNFLNGSVMKRSPASTNTKAAVIKPLISDSFYNLTTDSDINNIELKRQGCGNFTTGKTEDILTYLNVVNQKNSETTVPVMKGTAEEFANIMEGLVGSAYIWGGESFEEGGFDCSGSIIYALNKMGNKIPRVCADDLYKDYTVPVHGSAQRGYARFMLNDSERAVHVQAITDADGTRVNATGDDTNTIDNPGSIDLLPGPLPLSGELRTFIFEGDQQ